jgi:hypothetical protein
MNRSFVIGAAVAVGAVMMVPGVAAALGRAGKPLARAAMRTGAVAYDEFRAAAAEAYEQVEDIVAEVREEMHEQREAEMHDAAGPADAAGNGADGDGD